MSNLRTAIDRWAAALAEDAEHPKPNHSVDGVTYDWAAWRASLLQSIKAAKEILSLADYIITPAE